MAKNKISKSKSSNNIKSVNNSEELKMIKSPLTEAFDNRQIIAKSVGNTIRSFLIFNVIIGIIILIINVYAILWIHKLDTINCACSESYMRSYIKYYLYVFIPFICMDCTSLLFCYCIFNNNSRYVNDIYKLTISSIIKASS